MLFFQVLEPGKLRHAGPGVLAFSGIKCRFAQAVLAHSPLAGCCRMATICASLNRPFFISQSSGSESYAFLYSQLACYLGKRTLQIGEPGVVALAEGA